MPVQDRMTRWWIPPEMWRRMQPLNLEFSNRWTGTPPVDGRLVSSCDLWYLVMFHSWIKNHWIDEWRDGWTGTDKLDERFLGSCFDWQAGTSDDIMNAYESMNVKQIVKQFPSLPAPATPWSWLLSHSRDLPPPRTQCRFAASKTTAFWGYNSFLMVPQRPTTSTLDGALRATLFFLYYLLILTKDDAVIFFVPRVCVLLTLLAVQEALQKCEALESLLADERMRLMSRVEEARSCREREDTILGRCPFIGNIQGRVIFHWGKWQLQEEEGWGWRSNPYTIFIWFHHGDGWESQFNNQTLRFPKLLPKWDKSSPWQLGQLQRNNIKLTYMTSYDRSLSWRMVANGTNRNE